MVSFAFGGDFRFRLRFDIDVSGAAAHADFELSPARL